MESLNMNLTFVTPTILNTNAPHWKQQYFSKSRERCGTVHPLTIHTPRMNYETPGPRSNISRRGLLQRVLAPLVLANISSSVYKAGAAEAGSSTTASPPTTSDLKSNEKAIQEFREVTGLQDLAFEYTNRYEFAQAEILWTKIISLNEENAAAFSNRGNCRTSQGKFDDAVSDFNRAISLSPEEPDPYLGKGVALEGLKDFRGALVAYEEANKRSVKKYQTEDAVALNNMGNARGALGEWNEAFTLFKQASDMDSRFVFALANEALALFQIERDEEALKKMKFLVRKYPRFGDMHAAIAMALWEKGSRAQAEDEWYKAVDCDARYRDVEWVRDFRRWPPRLVSILQNFLSLS